MANPTDDQRRNGKILWEESVSSTLFMLVESFLLVFFGSSKSFSIRLFSFDFFCLQRDWNRSLMTFFVLTMQITLDFRIMPSNQPVIPFDWGVVSFKVIFLVLCSRCFCPSSALFEDFYQSFTHVESSRCAHSSTTHFSECDATSEMKRSRTERKSSTRIDRSIDREGYYQAIVGQWSDLKVMYSFNWHFLFDHRWSHWNIFLDLYHSMDNCDPHRNISLCE